MVVLDTNVLMEYSKGNKEIIKKINSMCLQEVAITAFNADEFLYGLYLKNSSDEIFLGKELLKKLKILNFSFASANKSAELRLKLRKKGQIIDDYDLCIASICIVNNESLLTLNKKHFQRIRELKLV